MRITENLGPSRLRVHEVSTGIGDGDVHPPLSGVAAVQLVGQIRLQEHPTFAATRRGHAQCALFVRDPVLHDEPERALEGLDS